MVKKLFLRSVIKYCLCAAVGFCFAATLATAGELPGRLLMTGVWHGQEVQAESGETWLALVHNAAGSWGLLRVDIAVQAVQDEILDHSGQMTGRKVTLPAVDVEPLVLINDLPALQPGTVPGAAIEDAGIGPDSPARVHFAGADYTLAIVCPKTLPGRELVDCPLVLTDGTLRQKLQTYAIHRSGAVEAGFAGDAAPTLLWAGDLDHDGRLDLLIDLTTHYNQSAPTLLLSSRAEKGELVKPVATFITTGC